MYAFLVSDINMAVNSIIFQGSCTRLAVSPRNEHVSVAYNNDHGLCVWNDKKGELVLDKSSHYLTALEFSPLGDHLIYCDGEGVKIWDIDTYVLIGGPYPVPEHPRAIAFSSTGKSFVTAFETPG